MPQFTIDLPQKAVDKLQAIVSRTNDNQGTSYTLRQWLLLHLKELAIADDLTASLGAIRDQQERDAQAALDAAVRAERDRLLQEL